MFRGVNALNLDAKGRLAMPSKYRDRLGDACAGQLVATVSVDGGHCLLLYPLPEFEEIERKLVKLPSLNPQARRLKGLLIGHAAECELDGAGRILVPPGLREYAGLDKRVVLVGLVNKFELWDEQRWNEQRTAWLSEDSEQALPAELETLSI
ncbi:division/cell wall cluster transcriptional repressor MraZ [Ectothiorhodospiraceae bacterium 2226]|nr:division/cell wall cluster transcriptional repressor MraZ [Ectothiorhodospiraceae bacterium 2226]